MIKRSYSWYLILLNYSILLIRHDNYDICINNTLNNYEQGKCRLRLKLFCNFILSERINKVYIYNIIASMFSVSMFFLFFFILFYSCFFFFRCDRVRKKDTPYWTNGAGYIRSNQFLFMRDNNKHILRLSLCVSTLNNNYSDITYGHKLILELLQAILLILSVNHGPIFSFASLKHKMIISLCDCVQLISGAQ